MKTLTFVFCLIFVLSIITKAGNVNLALIDNDRVVAVQSDTLLNSIRGNNSVESDSLIQENEKAFTDIASDLDKMEDSSLASDTTKIRIGKMNLTIVDDGDDIIISKKDSDVDDWDEDWTLKDDNDFNCSKKNRKNHFKPHWAGLSLGLNNYVNSDFSTNLPSDGNPNDQLLAINTNNSLEFNLNIAQFGINLLNQNIGLASGVGFKWNNYKFRNTNTVLVSDSTPLFYYENNEDLYKFSKLTTCYLVVPILLEFQVHTAHETIYFLVGVEGGLKLGAWTKLKGTNDQKIKDKSDFHTTPWDYRLTARVGYGSIGVFGTYGMLSVFEQDKGPELHPVTIGMSLNF